MNLQQNCTKTHHVSSILFFGAVSLLIKWLGIGVVVVVDAQSVFVHGWVDVFAGVDACQTANGLVRLDCQFFNCLGRWDGHIGEDGFANTKCQKGSVFAPNEFDKSLGFAVGKCKWQNGFARFYRPTESALFEGTDGLVTLPHATFGIGVEPSAIGNVLLNCLGKLVGCADIPFRHGNATCVANERFVFATAVGRPTWVIRDKWADCIHNGNVVPNVHVVGDGNYALLKQLLVLFDVFATFHLQENAHRHNGHGKPYYQDAERLETALELFRFVDVGEVLVELGVVVLFDNQVVTVGVLGEFVFGGFWIVWFV